MPTSLVAPEYVGRQSPREHGGDDVYSPEEIELIRAAGRIAAGAIEAAGAAVAPGVTTDVLDAIAHDYVVSHGAYPSTLGYRGYPKSCCTSLNEVICHGIPDNTVIQEGDLVNIDITAYKDGMHGDLNKTFLAGEASEEAALLVERTEEALETQPEFIAAACPFCNTMMTDGVKNAEKEGSIQVKDLAELIAEAQEL